MKKIIPIYKPSFTEKERQYVMDCFDSTWISSKGKYLKKFEESFAQWTKIKYATSTNNGTSWATSTAQGVMRAVAPDNGNTVLAFGTATTSMYASDNNGSSWSDLGAYPVTFANLESCDSAATRTVWICGNTGVHRYKHGVWHNMNNNIATDTVWASNNAISVAVDYENTATVYLGFWATAGGKRTEYIFKSLNANNEDAESVTWNNIRQNLDTCGKVWGMSINPHDDQPYISTDHGNYKLSIPTVNIRRTIN